MIESILNEVVENCEKEMSRTSEEKKLREKTRQKKKNTWKTWKRWESTASRKSTTSEWLYHPENPPPPSTHRQKKLKLDLESKLILAHKQALEEENNKKSTEKIYHPSPEYFPN